MFMMKIGGNPKLCKPFKDWLKRRLRVAEKLRSSYPNETPTEAFKNRLPSHIFGQLLDRMEPIAVTFNRQSPPTPHHN